MSSHNLDLMYIENNLLKNIFNIIIQDEGKPKNNRKSMKDLNDIYKQFELNIDERNNKYPKVSYTPEKTSKIILFNWVKEFKFNDGYV